jgi:hypothetical protein
VFGRNMAAYLLGLGPMMPMDREPPEERVPCLYGRKASPRRKAKRKAKARARAKNRGRR